MVNKWEKGGRKGSNLAAKKYFSGEFSEKYGK